MFNFLYARKHILRDIISNLSVNFSLNYKKIKKDFNKSLTQNNNSKHIINEINDKGFFLLESVLDESKLKMISSEFEFVIQNRENEFKDNNSNSIQVRYFNKYNLFDEKLLSTFAVFNDHYIKRIVSNLLNSNFVYNSQIFFQETNETNDPLAGEIHFDKLHQLKVWIFVNDVDEFNGPIELYLKSHLVNKEKRKNCYRELKEIDNCYKGEDFETVKIKGKAGSILIFDSDLYHRATKVVKNNRKIIRGHSMSYSTLKYQYELERSLHKN